MTVTSPLGKYAQVGALIVCLGVIAVWALCVLLASLHVADDTAQRELFPFAFAAFSAIIASAGTVNGVKPAIDAANRRVDVIESHVGVDTHAVANETASQ